MAVPEKSFPHIFSILTLFPRMFKGSFSESILKRAEKEELIEINVYNIRLYLLQNPFTSSPACPKSTTRLHSRVNFSNGFTQLSGGS